MIKFIFYNRLEGKSRLKNCFPFSKRSRILFSIRIAIAIEESSGNWYSNLLNFSQAAACTRRKSSGKYFKCYFIKPRVLNSNSLHISLSFVGFYVSHAWWPRLLTFIGRGTNDVIVSRLMFNILLWWSLFCYACQKPLTAEPRNKWTHHFPCRRPKQVVPLQSSGLENQNHKQHWQN